MPKGPLLSSTLLSIIGSSSWYTGTGSSPFTTGPEYYFDVFGQAIWKKDYTPFNQHKDTHLPGLLKAWRKAQPVRASWEKLKNNKETDPQKGIEATNLIRDYTFGIRNKCLTGTAWILDYEIPNNGRYPTKFFFGTSAHIMEGLGLDQSNPYNQTLPKDHKCSNSKTIIFKETDLNSEGPNHFIPSSWDESEKGHLPKVGKFNKVNKWRTKPKDQDPPYYYFKTEKVKLVYVALNFAGTNNSEWGWCQWKTKNYMADFAVIEIDFQDPKIARRITRDFHTKYHYLKGTHKHKSIDFFARPLMERKTNRQMYRESLDIFVAGYPRNGLKGRSVGSFNLNTRQASKLTYVPYWYMLKDDKKDEIIGHANTCYLQEPVKGYGDNGFPRGVELLLDHEPLEKGSSGSLTTDGEENALGVKSRKGPLISHVDVFRSPQITFEGKTIIPEYDLLESVFNKSQHRSYMDSIVTYVLSKKRKTHLSEMRKWGTQDSEALKHSSRRNSTKDILFPKRKRQRLLY